MAESLVDRRSRNASTGSRISSGMMVTEEKHVESDRCWRGITCAEGNE